MPDLIKDGPRFFPNVLKDPEFKKHGILFGINDGGYDSVVRGLLLHGKVPWAVVDPRRHILYVWQKTTPLFPDTGVTLGSSVFTNGSFNVYKGGNTWKQRLAAWLMVNVYATVANGFFWIFGIKVDAKMAMKFALYSSEESEGFVIGNHAGINETKASESRPAMQYFGRKAGRLFGDYAIAAGDPSGASEWIGGLFRTVNNYQFGEAVDQSITAGIWGLAPLDVTDADLKDAGIEQAIEEYLKDEPQSDSPPPREVTGLIITAFYAGPMSEFAAILGKARVKDAARIDGSDSIVMGRGNALVFDAETEKKKLYNRWGFQCQAG